MQLNVSSVSPHTWETTGPLADGLAVGDVVTIGKAKTQWVVAEIYCWILPGRDTPGTVWVRCCTKADTGAKPRTFRLSQIGSVVR